jgi:hypothetical protein
MPRSLIAQQGRDDSEEFLAQQFGVDPAQWADIARSLASLMFCEDSLGVWL